MLKGSIVEVIELSCESINDLVGLTNWNFSYTQWLAGVTRKIYHTSLHLMTTMVVCYFCRGPTFPKKRGDGGR